jgi:DNA-binding NarL/FixJ family response regulator
VTTKILIADNHVMVRDGLATLLKKSVDCEIVAVASDGRQAVRMAEEYAPDVIIMDVNMPDLNGIEAAGQIKALLPKTRIVALSAHADKRYVRGMLRAGAAAYILKDNAFDDLVVAIRKVLQGRRHFSQKVVDIALDDYADTLGHKDDALCSRLTDREREVFQLLAEGKTADDISRRLHVSTRTVSTHKTNLMKKLGCTSLAELTMAAVREGLINPDE